MSYERGRLETPGEPNPVEIERKFLVARLPENIGQYRHAFIRQGYISINPDGSEDRVRAKGNKFTRTQKSGSGLTREEVEAQITPEDFGRLWPQTKGRRVEKTRYDIPYQGAVIELDIYSGELDGLFAAEVEFTSEETSRSFSKPDWFGEEVTDDKRYKNQTLATQGIPSSAS
jgi:adenylate cyclase